MCVHVCVRVCVHVPVHVHGRAGGRAGVRGRAGSDVRGRTWGWMCVRGVERVSQGLGAQ